MVAVTASGPSSGAIVAIEADAIVRVFWGDEWRGGGGGRNRVADVLAAACFTLRDREGSAADDDAEACEQVGERVLRRDSRARIEQKKRGWGESFQLIFCNKKNDPEREKTFQRKKKHFVFFQHTSFGSAERSFIIRSPMTMTTTTTRILLHFIPFGLSLFSFSRPERGLLPALLHGGEHVGGRRARRDPDAHLLRREVDGHGGDAGRRLENSLHGGGATGARHVDAEVDDGGGCCGGRVLKKKRFFVGF